MILSEHFNENDRKKFDAYKALIETLNTVNFDSIDTRKFKGILANLTLSTTEIQEHTKTIEHRSDIYRVELAKIIDLIIDTRYTMGDPKEYEPQLRAVLSLIEDPTRFDISPTSLIHAIQKPIPDGILFPYAAEHTIKLRAGVPTIIGAYTGIGKSSVMLNMVYKYYKENLELEERKKNSNDITKEPLKQWIYSLEMSSTDIATYLLQLHIQDNRKYDTDKTDGYTVYREWKQYEKELSSLNEYITVYSNDNRIDQISIREIEVRLEYAAATNTLPDILYIDYLQIIEQEKVKDPNQDRRFQIIDIMGRLAQIAKKYKIYLVLLSQANRAGVDIKTLKDNSNYQGTRFPAPSMGSLQESSFIEQVAGLVLMLGRTYLKDKDFDILEVSIEKNRYGSSRINTFYCIDKVSRLIGKVDTDFTKGVNSK